MSGALHLTRDVVSPDQQGLPRCQPISTLSNCFIANIIVPTRNDTYQTCFQVDTEISWYPWTTEDAAQGRAVAAYPGTFLPSFLSLSFSLTLSFFLSQWVIKSFLLPQPCESKPSKRATGQHVKSTDCCSCRGLDGGNDTNLHPKFVSARALHASPNTACNTLLPQAIMSHLTYRLPLVP